MYFQAVPFYLQSLFSTCSAERQDKNVLMAWKWARLGVVQEYQQGLPQQVLQTPTL